MRRKQRPPKSSSSPSRSSTGMPLEIMQSPIYDTGSPENHENPYSTSPRLSFASDGFQKQNPLFDDFEEQEEEEDDQVSKMQLTDEGPIYDGLIEDQNNTVASPSSTNNNTTTGNNYEELASPPSQPPEQLYQETELTSADDLYEHIPNQLPGMPQPSSPYSEPGLPNQKAASSLYAEPDFGKPSLRKPRRESDFPEEEEEESEYLQVFARLRRVSQEKASLQADQDQAQRDGGYISNLKPWNEH
eukprot:m.161862 g.161862  ORF g.161862 m.161862 type:complete len:245 (+) comp24866_c0_seq1:910-1644(+)